MVLGIWKMHQVKSLFGGATRSLKHNTIKGRFTLWPKVERPLIPTNHVARNQEFGLSTLHTKVKVQRPSHFKMLTFWRRQRTLEGSLGWTGMETQTMVKRPPVFISLKNQSLTRSWPLDWRGCFEQGIKWNAPSSFGLWAWPLEASHYGRPSWEAGGVHGQRFGVQAWPLEASHYASPKAPIPIFHWLFSSHSFGLATKFGHSIPWPLDLGAHSVKQP
jgi:hypothetical protein